MIEPRYQTAATDHLDRFERATKTLRKLHPEWNDVQLHNQAEVLVGAYDGSTVGVLDDSDKAARAKFDLLQSGASLDELRQFEKRDEGLTVEDRRLPDTPEAKAFQMAQHGESLKDIRETFESDVRVASRPSRMSQILAGFDGKQAKHLGDDERDFDIDTIDEGGNDA